MWKKELFSTKWWVTTIDTLRKVVTLFLMQRRGYKILSKELFSRTQNHLSYAT